MTRKKSRQRIGSYESRSQGRGEEGSCLKESDVNQSYIETCVKKLIIPLAFENSQQICL